MKKASLKTQTISTFLLIIFLSMVCTIATIGTYLFTMYFAKDPMLKPDNYYQKQSDKIQQFIVSKGENILGDKNRLELESLIPKKGIGYQITDLEGKIIYGNEKMRIIKNKKQLIESINKTDIDNLDRASVFGSKVKRYIPILDSDSNVKGVAIIKYNIETSVKKDKNEKIVRVFQVFLPFSPFVYIIIFTIIFTRKLIKSIQQPINEIIDASNKIKEKDLDFEINYKSNNELGKLVSSFEEMKNALKESLNKQWIMEEDRKEMIKAIAHDLKTPITVIQGHVEVLMEGGIKDPIRVEKYLNIIKANTERMGRLISDMNLTSEIENKNFDLAPVKVDIIEFLEKKQQDYKVLCKDKNIEFKLFLEKNLNLNKEFSIDAERLEQILDNIISNAIRHTPSGKSIITKVKIYDYVIKFIVEDEGTGFNDKELCYVFEKFYRGDSSRSKEKGHSGLGMYIVKILVEKHNGWITAENKENGGARIKFIIKEI
ncbi:HAMP domain-containing histidine kinase [Clostridium sporogenes]|uniref:sensor histidine kinase n=1 Tax=Clostridium sporogenes TaxID=1509 RepID=UPI0013D7C936|nr:HAMP domain-containing sensor histidine kinase [Clostridium sporogenes]MBU5300622.1 HAMP domain-containing histidine kinase [Clostridium sporogenes]NFP90332.1 HAMP domain-containing histidine kinase [Clostridium sporogenes]